MRIYSGPLSMFGAKVEIAAREKGIDFDLVMVPFDPARGCEPKHPDVDRINPKRRSRSWSTESWSSSIRRRSSNTSRTWCPSRRSGRARRSRERRRA